MPTDAEMSYLSESHSLELTCLCGILMLAEFNVTWEMKIISTSNQIPLFFSTAVCNSMVPDDVHS